MSNATKQQRNQDRAKEKAFKRAAISITAINHPTTPEGERQAHLAHLERFYTKYEIDELGLKEWIKLASFRKKKGFTDKYSPINMPVGSTWATNIGDILNLYFPQVRVGARFQFDKPTRRLQLCMLAARGRQIYNEHVLTIWKALILLGTNTVASIHEERAKTYERQVRLAKWRQMNPYVYQQQYATQASGIYFSTSSSSNIQFIPYQTPQQPTEEELAAIECSPEEILYDPKSKRNIDWENNYMLGYWSALHNHAMSEHQRRYREAQGAENNIREDEIQQALLISEVVDDNFYGPLPFGGLLTYDPQINMAQSFSTELIPIPEGTAAEESTFEQSNTTEEEPQEVDVTQPNPIDIMAGQGKGYRELQAMLRIIDNDIVT